MIVVEFPAPDLLVAFTVPGEPMSKARARVVNGHAFTPERTRVAEAKVQAAFLGSRKRYAPKAEAGYRVEAEFHAYTRQRRDVDNMLKLVLDALNGLAWVDDNQVVEIAGRKALVAKDEARTEVRIFAVEPLLGMQVACEECGKKIRTYPSLQALGRRWCSIPCRTAWRRRQRLRTCKGCGVEFDPPEGQNDRQRCRSCVIADAVVAR